MRIRMRPHTNHQLSKECATKTIVGITSMLLCVGTGALSPVSG